MKSHLAATNSVVVLLRCRFAVTVSSIFAPLRRWSTDFTPALPLDRPISRMDFIPLLRRSAFLHRPGTAAVYSGSCERLYFCRWLLQILIYPYNVLWRSWGTIVLITSSPFARFLITNPITGTPGFPIIFPPSFPRLTYIAPRYLLDFCRRRRRQNLPLFSRATTMLFYVFRGRIAIAFKDAPRRYPYVIFLLIFHYSLITQRTVMHVCVPFFFLYGKTVAFLF